jgi:hypothetical protein
LLLLGRRFDNVLQAQVGYLGDLNKAKPSPYREFSNRSLPLARIVSLVFSDADYQWKAKFVTVVASSS